MNNTSSAYGTIMIEMDNESDLNLLYRQLKERFRTFAYGIYFDNLDEIKITRQEEGLYLLTACFFAKADGNLNNTAISLLSILSDDLTEFEAQETSNTIILARLNAARIKIVMIYTDINSTQRLIENCDVLIDKAAGVELSSVKGKLTKQEVFSWTKEGFAQAEVSPELTSLYFSYDQDI